MAAKEKSLYDLSGVNVTRVVSNALNKKGHLKGEKKEVKRLRSVCTHHVINKRGKIKPRFHENGKNVCQCNICRETWKADYYSTEEVDSAIGGIKPIASQAKFIAQAINADQKTIQTEAAFNLYLDNFGKDYKNLVKVAVKKDKNKNNKKKKGKKSSIGGWDIR